MSLPMKDQPGGTSSDENDDDDDDELEDNGQDWATSRPSSKLAISDHDAQIGKFLDRLAELLSRQKSSAECRGGQAAKHISAAAWISPDTESPDPLIVIIAKNEGLDDRDLEMLARLQRWLRAVAATGRVPLVQTDRLWIKDECLVAYSRGRLWFYILWLKENDEKVTALAALSDDSAVPLAHLQSLCRDCQEDSPTQQFSGIVDVAYSLRLSWKARPIPGMHTRPVRTISLLGRLRAAYECFKSVALTFGEIQHVEFKPIPRLQDVRKKVTLSHVLLQRVRAECHVPVGLLEDENRHNTTFSLHVHAEMQILVALVQNLEWHKRTHSYIGVSKKLCFLCDRILRNFKPLADQGLQMPIFRARESHKKVYRLWTLPRCEDLPCIRKLSLAAAVEATHREMREELQKKLKPRRAIAESTAGVRSVGSLPAELVDEFTAKARPPEASMLVDEGQGLDGLGPSIKTVNVGVLPVDGGIPRLDPIAFHSILEGHYHKGREYGQNYVPDLQQSLGPRRLDRRFIKLESIRQGDKDLEGSYRIYWSENPGLPENEYVKRLLGIAGDVDPSRRFWYGDIYVLRFSEHPRTFKFDVYDTSCGILQCEEVKQEFERMWKDKYIEAEQEDDQYFGALREKHVADKEILWQRM